MNYQYDTLDSTITIHRDCRVYIPQRKRHETYEAGTTFHVIRWMGNFLDIIPTVKVVAPGGLICVIAFSPSF